MLCNYVFERKLKFRVKDCCVSCGACAVRSRAILNVCAETQGNTNLLPHAVPHTFHVFLTSLAFRGIMRLNCGCKPPFPMHTRMTGNATNYYFKSISVKKNFNKFCSAQCCYKKRERGREEGERREGERFHN